MRAKALECDQKMLVLLGCKFNSCGFSSWMRNTVDSTYAFWPGAAFTAARSGIKQAGLVRD